MHILLATLTVIAIAQVPSVIMSGENALCIQVLRSIASLIFG